MWERGDQRRGGGLRHEQARFVKVKVAADCRVTRTGSVGHCHCQRNAQPTLRRHHPMTSLVDISGAAPLDVVDPLDVLEAGSVRRKSLPAGSLGRLPAGSLGRLPAGSLGRLTAENRPSGGAGLTSRHGEISGDSTNTGSRTAELEQLSQLLPGAHPHHETCHSQYIRRMGYN